MSLFGEADPWKLLTDSVLIALLLAVVATWPVSVLLLHAYRRSITRGMRRSGTATAPPIHPHPTRPADRRIDVLPVAFTGPVPLLGRAKRRAHRVQLLFLVGGLVYGFGASVSLIVIEDLGWLPLRTVILTLLYAWPTVPTLLFLSSWSRRGVQAVWAGYVITVVVLMALGGLSFSEIIILTLFTIATPALVLLATGAPALQGAAWLVVPALMLTVTLGCVLSVVMPYLSRSEDPLRYGWWFILSCLGIALAVVAVSAGYAWCFARVYRRKWASDQTLRLLQWWFLSALGVTLILSPKGGPRALLGLAPYLLLVLILLVAATRFRPPTDRSVRLLLLRTFGSRGRSTRLFRDLTRQWRWIGSVELIIAPDLASETLEPDELLDFLFRRLPERFVQDEPSLRRRLSSLDLAPDRDARYRVNELLCHDDMWRPAVEALAQGTDAVLIDLRGFTAGHAGVSYELERLVALVPLSRVVAVVDGSTDLPTLERALDRAAALAPTSSPLRADLAPTLSTVDLSDAADSSRRLLEAVGRAASEGLPAPARR